MIILDEVRGSHRVIIDDKDGWYRVICNTQVHITYNQSAMGGIVALGHALNYVKGLPTDCQEYPKS